MPFGEKCGKDGSKIDFNRIYRELIAPSVEAAGLSAFRADEERRAGDIRADMFQELLLADLVVADLTIDNPNVWYELGVRHALRARGVVLICGGHATTAFDVYTERKLRYGIANGGPDPATLEEDRANLTKMVRATMESWHGRKISPVYQLLPHLDEPEWKKLRLGNVQEFWEQHDQWERRVDLARKAGEIGDILLLADEAPVAWFRAEAWIRVGQSLRKAGRYAFALEQLERGLAIKPNDRVALHEKGICLQRLAQANAPGHTLDQARNHYNQALALHPNDPELLALLGRVEKDEWTRRCRDQSGTCSREEAKQDIAFLSRAIESYGQAYHRDPTHYFSGINALTLMSLRDHLTGDKLHALEIVRMAGAVRFVAEAERSPTQKYWALATLADLEILTGTIDAVREAYGRAAAAAEGDWFALNSTREQLRLLLELEFRPDAVRAGIAVLDRALGQLKRPADKWEARKVFLFSGHMVDAPNRPKPRFPAEKVEAARQRIEAVLREHHAGPEDLSISQAAAGGDLLFLETSQALGVRCLIHLPFDQGRFVTESVLPSAGGEGWRQRFLKALSRPGTTVRQMESALGPTPADTSPFVRCNLWSLYGALARGVDRVHFICLWDGSGGDGPGGTAHMHKEVQDRTGNVNWIDARTL
jgi:tetratricopeptide (TPR) repeat protein